MVHERIGGGTSPAEYPAFTGTRFREPPPEPLVIWRQIAALKRLKRRAERLRRWIGARLKDTDEDRLMKFILQYDRSNAGVSDAIGRAIRKMGLPDEEEAVFQRNAEKLRWALEETGIELHV